MASAREYFRNKQNELYSREYQQNLRRHRQKVTTIAIVSVAVIVIVCISIYIYNRNRVYSDYEVVNEIERKESDSSQYIQMEDQIVRYSMDGISGYDKDFQVIWNQSYEMKKPIIDVCGSYIAVCDTSGTTFYVLSKDGVKGEVDTQLPIKRIEVADQGVVAVLLEDGDVNRINYYDRMGTLLAETKAPVEKSGFIMDISLSNDGMKLAVSYMTMNTGSVNAKVAFYNFDTVGANEIDHLVSAQEYEGAVVPQIEFVNATTAVVFGDSFFDIFQGSQKPVEQKKKEIDKEIRTIFHNETYFGMVLENEGDMPYLLKIYDMTGDEKLSLPLNQNYEQIKIKEENVYITDGSQCLIYNFSGRLKYEGNFKETIVDILPLNEERMIVVQQDIIQTVRLK